MSYEIYNQSFLQHLTFHVTCVDDALYNDKEDVIFIDLIEDAT